MPFFTLHVGATIQFNTNEESELTQKLSPRTLGAPFTLRLAIPSGIILPN